MPTKKLNKQFEEQLFEDSLLLDNAIEWIKTNMTIDQVYNQEDIKNHVEDGNPEDYFSESQLRQWAEDNGYVMEASVK
jgi:hypothetical protein